MIRIVSVHRTEPPALIRFRGSVYYKTGRVGTYTVKVHGWFNEDRTLLQYEILNEDEAHSARPAEIWAYANGEILPPEDVVVGLG